MLPANAQPRVDAGVQVIAERLPGERAAEVVTRAVREMIIKARTPS